MNLEGLAVTLVVGGLQSALNSEVLEVDPMISVAVAVTDSVALTPGTEVLNIAKPVPSLTTV